MIGRWVEIGERFDVVISLIDGFTWDVTTVEFDRSRRTNLIWLSSKTERKTSSFHFHSVQDNEIYFSIESEWIYSSDRWCSPKDCGCPLDSKSDWPMWSIHCSNHPREQSAEQQELYRRFLLWWHLRVGYVQLYRRWNGYVSSCSRWHSWVVRCHRQTVSIDHCCRRDATGTFVWKNRSRKESELCAEESRFMLVSTFNLLPLGIWMISLIRMA